MGYGEGWYRALLTLFSLIGVNVLIDFLILEDSIHRRSDRFINVSAFPVPKLRKLYIR